MFNNLHWIRVAVVLLATLSVVAVAQDQDEQLRTGPPSGTSAQAVDPADIRHSELFSELEERGIPRDLLAPGDEERSQEGFRDGVPDLRVRPEIRPGDPAPYWLPPRTQWKLGVYAYNTDAGVVITRVVRGGPAARAGLERGDTVVNVGGHQVGYVGDRLFPLGYELQHHAGQRGHVGLLVQNVRNRDLITLDVRLEREWDFD